MEKLRVFESFSGVGSQRMALRNIGCNFEVVGISEVDKNALLAYDSIHENQENMVDNKTKDEMILEMREANIAYNFSTGKDEMPRSEKDVRKLYMAHKRSKNYGDITKLKAENLPDFDFFTYSFPCKNISVAGKQAGLEKGSGTQSSLVWECERIIRAKMPKYLMMENVKNICGKQHMKDFQAWIDLLKEIGYKSFWKVLNGKDYSVPQNRERVIMISVLEDKDFQFPDKIELKTRLIDILEDLVDDKYFIDINNLIVKDDMNNSSKSSSTDNSLGLKQVGMLNILGNESNRRVYDSEGLCPTINSMNGGNRQPKILIREATKLGYKEAYIGDSINFEHPNSKTRRGRVGKQVAQTLTTSCNQGVLDENMSVRKLTPLECWRLMGFSDEDFYKARDIGGLSNSKLYERAGRGIVVPMLEEIFKNLFKEYIN